MGTYAIVTDDEPIFRVLRKGVTEYGDGFMEELMFSEVNEPLSL